MDGGTLVHRVAHGLAMTGALGWLARDTYRSLMVYHRVVKRLRTMVSEAARETVEKDMAKGRYDHVPLVAEWRAAYWRTARGGAAFFVTLIWGQVLYG